MGSITAVPTETALFVLLGSFRGVNGGGPGKAGGDAFGRTLAVSSGVWVGKVELAMGSVYGVMVFKGPAGTGAATEWGPGVVWAVIHFRL